ncbi:G-type lectin S-receptor-like serine/threonine-protein kinase LECRK3 [Cinnamomum micranthum f. kanehirae]|uniref:non-specific serine/threonine protein kinase n=1 Tax=Cinnamomum micranthum f. kanehirae TaxID=337451 RepID=A0A443NUJ1_9MAGN|nr:G-type lectin S-receptor-like serine/threonine-protein kinase LECRK3 [Cinnamomum micranthum f. kanehirae]
MLDLSNFVLYNSDSQIIWGTFDFPTDTILGGQQLLDGKELLSSACETNCSSGQFQIKMQTDGNLAVYPIQTTETRENSYWNFMTFIQENVTLHLEDNGFMYSLNSTGSNIYTLTQGFDARIQSTTTNIYRATLEVDGVFRLYLHRIENDGSSTQLMIRSLTSQICEVKGLCGLNSYFVLNDTQPNCRCPPECLQDCRCEAALSKDRSCYKQKLPLQYWRRKLDDSTMAFVKFSIGTGDQGTEETPSISKKKPRKEILIVSAGVVSFSFVVLAILGFLIYKHRIWTYKLLSETINNGDESEDFAPRQFTYYELEKATDGFTDELVKGGFGTVYRGILAKGGQVVALKRPDRVVDEGDGEFRMELRAIGRTYHRNLVRLLGFCVEGCLRLLVHPTWNERVRIALHIASGILYLHEECETPIIHCDIKPQNILMDEFNSAKISDFGLAKLMKPDQARTFTTIRGTWGYVAPEWHRNMPVTVKADINSFGVMLLEIVCCRRSVNIEVVENEIVLSEWVYHCFKLASYTS